MSDFFDSLPQLAQQFDTPLFVYDSEKLEELAKAYAINNPNILSAYALKANSNIHLLKRLNQLGLGADVTSGGELFLALKAGFPPEKIIYSGVGKTADELQMAMDARIKAIHVESEMEWELLANLATESQKETAIGVRVNPNIFAETHPYISTGQASSKFGVDPETAVSLFHRSKEHPYLKPVGIAAHIGSQIKEFKAHQLTANYLVDFANRLKVENIPLAYIDIGGGLGIDYANSGDLPSISEWITAVSSPILQASYQLIMEPGRSIVGPTGYLLTKVLYTKQKADRQIVIVDAAMNDLLRPTLYQAQHRVELLNPKSTSLKKVNVVGPICESGDWLAKDIFLPSVQPSDLLVIHDVGAYGFAMGSNYNGRLRPAEILIESNSPTLIRQRQTLDDLLRDF